MNIAPEREQLTTNGLDWALILETVKQGVEANV